MIGGEGAHMFRGATKKRKSVAMLRVQKRKQRVPKVAKMLLANFLCLLNPWGRTGLHADGWTCGVCCTADGGSFSRSL